MTKPALLSRRPHQPPPSLTLWDDIALPLSRVHELCGRARRTLALRIAAQAGGPVIWIAPAWLPDRLHAPGMAGLIDPGDLIFVAPKQINDILWAMEEALRSGAAPVVVADLPEPPGMTPVRRLHLAAETGTGHGLCRPLGLLLTPDQGGAQGIETRWQMDPAHAPDQQTWQLHRLRARMLPPKTWQLDGAAMIRRSAP